MRRFVVVTLVILGVGAVRAEGPSTPDHAPAVDALFAPVRDGDAPGAAVLVARDGRILLERAWGLAHLELEVPNTPQTRFRIGSVTKPFTALAVLLLEEQGLLRIDEPVSRYLPDYPHGSRVTIRHLLTHTGGLPDFVSVEQSGQMPLDAEPGTRLNYTNTGYALLGRIVERVSGESYAQFLARRLFTPLGLDSTGVDDPSAIIKHRAAGYVRGPAGALENVQLGDPGAEPFAGGLSSTVGDLYKLARGLDAGTVLRRDTIERAWTPVALPGGRTGAYGLGWTVKTYRGLREVGHGGDIDGYNAWLAIYPDARCTVVVLSNLSMHARGPLPPAADLGRRIADIYLADRLAPDEPPVDLTLPTATLDRYVGRYRVDAPQAIRNVAGDVFTISRDGDRLFGQDRTMRVPLRAESETVFASPAAPVRLSFVVGADGRAREAIVVLADLREFRVVRID
jgi:D-alanyl-D-alanine carboxypeptidase